VVCWQLGSPAVGEVTWLMAALEQSHGQVELTLEEELLLKVQLSRPLWGWHGSDLLGRSCPSIRPAFAPLTAAHSSTEEAAAPFPPPRLLPLL
jgi:hypothetical protein